MDVSKMDDYEQILDFVNNDMPKLSENNLRGDALVAKSQDFFSALGSPQNDYKVVHVAGTMGKGTVVYLIDAILREHGFSTGKTISPHVYDMRERVQVDGQFIDKRDYVRLLKQIIKKIRTDSRLQQKMTYYEVNTLIAASLFSERKIDYAVIETGLGGLYDMTNSFNPREKLAVLARIGLDHTAVLGNTLEDIAVQKAGIIQLGNLVVTVEQNEEVDRVFLQTAESRKAHLTSIRHEEGLIGHYHKDNINLALESVKQIAERDGWQCDESKAHKATSNLIIPGRCEHVQVGKFDFIFDGAHNPDKAAGFVRILQSTFPGQKFTSIVSLKKSKDALGFIKNLAPVVDEVIFTTFLESQDVHSLAHDPEELRELAQSLGIKSVATSNAQEAVDCLGLAQQPVLVTGSNYLIGEIYDLVAASD